MSTSTTLFDEVGLTFDPGNLAKKPSTTRFERAADFQVEQPPAVSWPGLQSPPFHSSSRRAEPSRAFRSEPAGDRLFENDEFGSNSAPVKERPKPRPFSSSTPAMPVDSNASLFPDVPHCSSLPRSPHPPPGDVAQPSIFAQRVLPETTRGSHRKAQRGSFTQMSEVSWPRGSSSKFATAKTSAAVSPPTMFPATADHQGGKVSSSTSQFATRASSLPAGSQPKLARTDPDLFTADDQAPRSAGSDVLSSDRANVKASRLFVAPDGPSASKRSTRPSMRSTEAGTLFDGAADQGLSAISKPLTRKYRRIVLRRRRLRVGGKGRRFVLVARR